MSKVNPHYFEYQNKSLILITSGEHYGAVVNTDFDYLKYLDALQQEGMNNTRVFSGSVIEREQDIKWMGYGNTLAPKPGKVITPWARSSVSGYAGGGNKFDLNEWNANYFSRLKDFIKQAASRGIFVELTLFGNNYTDEQWTYSPLYPKNNIQDEGPSGEKSFLLFQTMKNKELVSRQELLAKKLVEELNSFDNLYYEICNEPYNEVKDSAAVDEWHNHMIDFIVKVESGLPKKHLIASNQAVVDNPAVSVANYHYVKIPHMPDFRWLYSLDKVISMDETMGSMVDATAEDVRVEAWDYMLRGGGSYNNLSWEYTPEKPEGTTGASTIRKQLSHLQKFMSKINYVEMKPGPEFIKSIPDSGFIRVLCDEGKQYGVYLHHSIAKGNDPIWGYKAIVKDFTDKIELDVPKGSYSVEWTNPATGKRFDDIKTIKHSGGSLVLTTPRYTTDVALQLTRNDK
ncbi:cellulase family glycosylhydrolase [Rubrolithibacter danxiaensis]|uniref:cellulase family glycosylhydrolase n=1 Tax=Rubrolithibacter danxiaensis TaxID=3390805 RepID=UPI003BF7E24A